MKIRIPIVIALVALLAVGIAFQSCPSQVIYPNDDPLVAANANDPSVGCWNASDGFVASNQVAFCQDRSGAISLKSRI